MISKMIKTDIIIIGAGPVGLFAVFEAFNAAFFQEFGILGIAGDCPGAEQAPPMYL